MSGLPIERIDHYMTEEELTAEFGKNGWKQLQDAFSGICVTDGYEVYHTLEKEKEDLPKGKRNPLPGW